MARQHVGNGVNEEKKSSNDLFLNGMMRMVRMVRMVRMTRMVRMMRMTRMIIVMQFHM